MGLFPPVGEDVLNRGAKIVKALFAGLPLAVRFREFGTDGGIAGFAVNRTVVKFDGQVHWEDVEAFYLEGKGPPEAEGVWMRMR